MTGTNFNILNVYIGHARHIATISIPVGSETELTLTYEPDWIKAVRETLISRLLLICWLILPMSLEYR